MKKARVFWFSDKKGFGLVKTASGEEYIVHYSLISNIKGWKSIEKGQRVEIKLCKKLGYVEEIRVDHG